MSRTSLAWTIKAKSKTPLYFILLRPSVEKLMRALSSDVQCNMRRIFDYSQNAVNRLFFYYFPVPKASTREEVLSNVVHALRDERLRQNLSMNRLAERSGLHVSMISLVERELRNPTL